jgi:hypothetical protein
MTDGLLAILFSAALAIIVSAAAVSIGASVGMTLAMVVPE